MKKLAVYLAVILVSATLSHFAMVWAAPYYLMSRAIAGMPNGGKNRHRWENGPPITEKSRGVIRPAADLLFSTCLYDLSLGVLRVTASTGGDYLSVSGYAANGDNFFVANDQEYQRGIEFLMVMPNQKLRAQTLFPQAKIVISPSPKGVLLQRRLAATKARLAAALRLRANDRCELISEGHL